MLKKLLYPGLFALITVIATTIAGAAFRDSSLEFSDEDSLSTSPFPSSDNDGQDITMSSDIPEERGSNRALDVNHPGPENLARPSPSVDVEMPSDVEIFPTVHSDDDSAMTSSSSSSAIFNIVNGIEVDNDGQGGDNFAPKEVVVIAICVVLLSLVIVVLAVVMSFLIRRRMRRKAYLRVKHASQTELAVHYVQNTPASVAARDAAMEQLFQSLASIDPDAQVRQDYCQVNCTADERCLSPTESIASVDFGGGKGNACSRSMPSLKNLNAHEEALSCNITSILHENSGKFKGRSRSFTERAALGVDVVGRAKMASRSHSEKLKNRVLLPTAGKRFEKKSNKTTNRRSAPSFFRLAKFGLLRTQSKRQKAIDVESDAGVQAPCIARPLEATDVVGSESRRDSSSILDFEMPCVSPIFKDIGPMFTALHDHHNHQHHHPHSRTSQLSVHSNNNNNNDMRTSQTSIQSARNSDSRQQPCKDNRGSNSKVSLQSGYLRNGRAHHHSDATIYVDAVSEVDGPPGDQKVPSLEEVRDEKVCRSHQKLGNGSNESARKAFSSIGHLQTSCKDVSVGNHNKQSIS